MTAERRKKIEGILDKKQPNLTVILEDIFDPHNISAVLRSCEAVGMYEVYVVNTGLERHRTYGKSSSSSAQKWMMVKEFESIKDCMEVVRASYDKVYSTHLSESIGSQSLYSLDLSESCALIFGNEKHGVSDEMQSYADGNFVISQYGIVQSLNISVACAVSLYEALRQKEAAGHYEKRCISDAQKGELLSYWNIDEKVD